MTEISTPPPPPPPPADPRRRLRELLAVPERDRSDEQWDEIVELEISLAPGNRLDSPDTNVRRTGPAPSGDRNKPAGDRRPNGDRNRPAGGPRPAGDRQQRNGPPRSGGDRQRNGPPRPNADAQPGSEQQPAVAAGVPGEPGSTPARKPFKKFHKRPPKANTPES